MRKTGILMAISSLPSNFGIGDFGPSAFSFVDYLVDAKVKIWQILPFNRLGYGNSPYQAYSSVAGDEIFISIDHLVEDGYLSLEDVTTFNEETTRVDYDMVRLMKSNHYRKAFQHFQANYPLYEHDFCNFVQENDWVVNYSVFLTLKDENNATCWTEWEISHRDWIVDKKADLTIYQEEILYYQFLQFVFFSQWDRLKAYANSNGISIMGDLAYYVGIDSLDVWANRELFLLDENCRPTHVAGVPPDFFSDSGQRWGNPIYNWERMAEDDFSFWIQRLHLNQRMFDCIRIDHFRAFHTFWKIPAHEETAVVGQWVEASGYAFFDTLFKQIPEINIVVEDLGYLMEGVHKLRDHYRFMGMEILQFSFTEDGTVKQDVLEGFNRKLVYTGTHDNQTSLGWFLGEPPKMQQKIKGFFADKGLKGNVVEQMIQFLLFSDAPIVIIPTCDILGLGDTARMNAPGTIASPNWEWKLADFDAFEKELPKFALWIKESNRLD